MELFNFYDNSNTTNYIYSFNKKKLIQVLHNFLKNLFLLKEKTNDFIVKHT